MKLNYILKSLALTALMMVSTNMKATDFYVANGASDTELAAALDQAQTDDVIWIDGIVTIAAPVEITKNVTIKGTDDGADIPMFDGAGATRLFEIHPEAVDGAKLVFDNVGFTGGNGAASDPTDGGVARIYDNGVIEFIQCWFDGNTAIRGGAFFITPGDLGAPSVTFKRCEATNNVAKGGGGESRGGYLFTDGADLQINHEYCIIKNNQSIGGRGGALCLFGDNTSYFYYCVISNNKGGHWGPDPSGITSDDVALKADGTAGEDGEYEGGVAFITGGATTFESCALVSNKSWSHAGLIRHLDGGDVTFINCTVAKNQSLHNKPVFWISGQTTYTFVNSLFVENLGQNVGNGAGFDFGDTGVKLNLFNSVFTRNVAGSDGAVDLSSGGTYAGLTVKNSMIGLIKGDPTAMTVGDNASIPTKSNTAMYKIASEESQLDYAALENGGAGCGVNFREGFKFSQPLKMVYYLLEAGSDVTKLGDPALLGDYDLNTDLFHKEHIIAADGSIPAAPTLANTEENQSDPTVSIAAPQSVAPGVKLMNTLVNNGIIGIDFGALRGATKAELYSVTGQKMENVFSGYAVGKGYYNLKTTVSGLYLLKVTVDGVTSTQRLIIK